MRDRKPDSQRPRRARPGGRGPADARGKGHRSTRVAGSTYTSAGNGMAQRGLGPPVTIVAYVEKGLYAITEARTASAERSAAAFRKYGNDKAAKPNLDRNRYHALNLTNLARGTKDTVEFRVFSERPHDQGDRVDSGCLGLVERASAESGCRPGAEAAFGRMEEGWPGQSEAERLIGYLAWGKATPHPRRPAIRMDFGRHPAGRDQGRVPPPGQEVRRAGLKPNAPARRRAAPRRSGGMGSRRLTRQTQRPQEKSDVRDFRFITRTDAGPTWLA